MSAPTVRIDRLTGYGGGLTYTDITGTINRFNAADDAANGTADPIQIPASGTNYSYWVATQLNCTVAPTAMIDNMSWYTTRSNPLGTGVDCDSILQSTYPGAAGGTPGVTGTSLSASGMVGSVVEVFGNYTSGSPLSVPGSTSGTGNFGYFVILQTTVGSTATGGVTPSDSYTALFTWSYEWF